MVEFAIVLPLLTLVAMGVIELGNAWHREQVVATAAREGARFGAQYNPSVDAAAVVAAVNQYLDGGKIDTLAATVQTNCCAASPQPDYITVTVTHTLRFPVMSRLSPLPATKVVTDTAFMRNERK